MFRLIATFTIWVVATTAALAQQAYILEADKSDVGFFYQLEGKENRGSMPVQSATIAIDFDQPARSSVDVTVDVTGAKSGFIFVTEALKARTVLDTDNHPTIRFRSTSVRPPASGRLSDPVKIDGQLTVKGVTKPITLTAQLFRQRGTESGDRSRLSFRLSGQLKRSDFGAAGFPKLVDDLIRLDIVTRLRSAQ